MRSPSVEGWDNITHLERGPLGTGGEAVTGNPHTVADKIALHMVMPEDGVNVGPAEGYGGVGLNPGSPAEDSEPNWEVPVA